MHLRRRERQILAEAIDAFQETVGLKAKVLPFPQTTNRLQADALLELTLLNGEKVRFVAEVKAVDRRIAVGQIRANLHNLTRNDYFGYLPVLITGFATPGVAEECRKLNLPYLDTVGNLYLRTDNVILDIRGRARPEQGFKTEFRANHRAGLKITFALLCRPALAGAQYRELARMARVGLGTIGPVLNDLTRRGFLQKGKTAAGTRVRTDELIKEWVTYYPANLRPTLRPRRYQAERELLTHLDTAEFGAYWGGEYGAERLVRYLKAENFLIYTPAATPPTLMAKARMRLAVDGNVETLQAFWNPDLDGPDRGIAPPLLIYADLMATAEPRNLEAAQDIYERFLRNPTYRP
jgi:hypothetical protein